MIRLTMVEDKYALEHGISAGRAAHGSRCVKRASETLRVHAHCLTTKIAPQVPSPRRSADRRPHARGSSSSADVQSRRFLKCKSRSDPSRTSVVVGPTRPQS